MTIHNSPDAGSDLPEAGALENASDALLVVQPSGSPPPGSANPATPVPAEEAGSNGAIEDRDPFLVARLDALDLSLNERLVRLEQLFEQRILYDRRKDEQIDHLHHELQEYRGDLVTRMMRPLFLALIRLHGDAEKVLSSLGQREDADPALYRKAIADLARDLELILAEHAVSTYESPGDAFDPVRQKATRTLPTQDSNQVGKIAQRLRRGFELNNLILQKELVAIFVPPPAP